MISLAEKIKVMQAFERGEEIQFVCCGYENWRDCTEPFWNWDTFDYRIKPKQQQVWFALLKIKATGKLITTNPCSKEEHVEKLKRCENTAIIIREYMDTI